jgi:hypothetical protein
MKINDYKIGTSFEINCTKQRHIRTGETIYDSFGINKNLAYMYGRKPEDVIKVKMTIIEEDVLLKDKFNDKNYDENCTDYFGLITWEDDNSLSIGLIYANIKLYNMCFPYEIDKCLFYDGDVIIYDYKTFEEKIVHKKGDRHRMTVRLKVEEI